MRGAEYAVALSNAQGQPLLDGSSNQIYEVQLQRTYEEVYDVPTVEEYEYATSEVEEYDVIGEVEVEVEGVEEFNVVEEVQEIFEETVDVTVQTPIDIEVQQTSVVTATATRAAGS